MRKYFLLLGMCVGVMAGVRAQEARPMSSVEIDSLVERTLRAFDVPGIAVCVIKDGKVVHSKGYGVRSLDTKLPVDENTLFGIASNSVGSTNAATGISSSRVLLQ